MYARRLDPSVLAFSLSLHRHPSICILFSSPFTSHSKQTERNSKTDIFSPGMDLLFHSDVLTSSIFVLDKKLTPSLVLFPQLSSQAEHDHQKNIPLLNMMTHHVYMIIFNTWYKFYSHGYIYWYIYRYIYNGSFFPLPPSLSFPTRSRPPVPGR